MLASLEGARQKIADHLAHADPDLISTSEAAERIELFAELRRLSEAGILLYTRRATQSVRWRDEGHKSPASWLAGTTKSPLGEALAMVETAEALEDLPGTSDALRSGELSFAQAKQIAPAAHAHPEAEARLLQVAAEDSMKGLKDACTRVRAVKGSAQAEIEAYNAIRRHRYLRMWTDTEGAFRMDARLTPDAGARVKAAVQGQADVLFREARARTDEDGRASPDAYRADALVALVTGTASHGAKGNRSKGNGSSGAGGSSGTNGSSPTNGSSGAGGSSGTNGSCPSVHLRVDATALRRGHVGVGEVCEIAGVGPVPVAVARRQLSDAALKYFAIKGTDVVSVCHVGRTIPAHVHSALCERDPVCVVPGCGVATGLEAHHWEVDYADCKTTSLSGLARICAFHHDLVTYYGYELEGGPGKWVLRPPPDADPFDTS